MKKTISVLLVLCLVSVLATTALAVVSPGVEITVSAINGNSADSANLSISDPVSAPTDEELTTISMSLSDHTVAKSFELTWAGNTPPTFPMTIRFHVPGVRATDDPHALHWNGTEWEILTTTVPMDDYVDVVFNSFSPVSIVVKKTSGAVSPRTDTNSMTFVGIAAAVSFTAAGALLILKRRSVKTH